VLDLFAGKGMDVEAPPLPPFLKGLDVPAPARLAARDPSALGQLIRVQLALALRTKSEYVVVREVRKHLVWYSRGLHDSSRFRASIHTAVDLESLEKLIVDFFDKSGDNR